MKMLDNCSEVEDLLSSFFDNTLDPVYKNKVIDHINICTICKNNPEYSEIINILPKIKSISLVKTSDDYLDKLKAKIEKSDSKVINFWSYLPRNLAIAGIIMFLFFNKSFIDRTPENASNLKISKAVVTRDLIKMDIVPPAYEIEDKKSTSFEMQEMDIGNKKQSKISESLKKMGI